MPTFKAILFHVLLILFSVSAISQQEIELSIKDCEHELYYLNQLKGDKINIIDSAICNSEKVLFTSNSYWEPGMYFIQNNYQGFTILVNEDKIKLETSQSHLEDSLRIISSTENSLWFNYLENKRSSFKKLDLLNPILVYYDRNTKLYEEAANEFERVQNAIISFADTIPKELMAYNYIKADLKPKLALGLEYDEQLEYLKEHYFDEIDWSDQRIITSNILSNKINDYLMLYSNKQLPKHLLQQEFIKAVDHIISQTNENPVIYSFVISHLLSGFERYDMQDVIMHIALNYHTKQDQCESGSDHVFERLKRYEAMEIGKIASDIILSDTKKLSNFSKKNKLIVFWATSCPHCSQLITQLNKWYQSHEKSNWDIVLISLDSDSKTLDRAIVDRNIILPVFCEFKSWESKSALDYNIYATPTMIAVDKDLRIIAKPSTYKEFESLVQD